MSGEIDIKTLVADAITRYPRAGCPLATLEGKAGEFVAALDKIDRANINRLGVDRGLKALGHELPYKRITAHFNGECSCGRT